LALANIDTHDIKHNTSSCKHIITVTRRALSTSTDAHYAINWMSFLPQLLTAVSKQRFTLRQITLSICNICPG